LLETSGVLEEPPRWNSRHNRSLPEVDSLINSGMQEFYRDDPLFKDSSFRSRIGHFFMFLPYSFEMRLEILNMTIARDVRSWGGCYLHKSSCGCYGCKQASYACECEESMKTVSTSKVAFTHRAKLQLLTKLSRAASAQRQYPNTRNLKVEVNLKKNILISLMEQCDLFEGDGLIIDYENAQFCGKVGMFMFSSCAVHVFPSITLTAAVALAPDREAQREACFNQRLEPDQSIRTSSTSFSSSDSDALSAHQAQHQAAAAHVQQQRQVQVSFGLAIVMKIINLIFSKTITWNLMTSAKFQQLSVIASLNTKPDSEQRTRLLQHVRANMWLISRHLKNLQKSAKGSKLPRTPKL
jgi:hypothetical protein